MVKKKSAGQKAAETKAKKPVTLADVDVFLDRALKRLNAKTPDPAGAKRAITNARKALRKACTLPMMEK